MGLTSLMSKMAVDNKIDAGYWMVMAPYLYYGFGNAMIETETDTTAWTESGILREDTNGSGLRMEYTTRNRGHRRWDRDQRFLTER
mmetsp:Transcript_4832/g.9770  ORF Transcript_4832/g.9770 Transcript_4832/m.9770 type:complete len:86 (+) Transcript_4832:239-496(+)